VRIPAGLHDPARCAGCRRGRSPWVARQRGST
jgi:hypothetical protein